jgi:hypothetical protein
MVEIDNILNEEDDNINDYKEVVETKKEVVNNKKIEKQKKPRTPAQIEAWDKALAKRRENIAKKKNGGLDPIKEEPVKEEPVKKEKPIKEKIESNNFINENTNFQPDLSKINKGGLKPQYESDEELNAWLNDNVEVEEAEAESESSEEEIIIKKPKKVQKQQVPKKSKPKKIKYVYEDEDEEEYEEPIYEPKPSKNSYDQLDMRSRLRLSGF